MDYQKYIRNFAIVAHIDHGKSTLADRLLEATGTIESRHMQEQVLDSNPIERERGITIKLAPVRMKYILNSSTVGGVRDSPPVADQPATPEVSSSHSEYILNLIDTPGHVDFSYEVSRSLAACDGILLVVDATQGIQAQTLSHMQLIKKNNLKVIPLVNKIDLALAKTEEVKRQIRETFGFSENEIIEISAKLGTNIDKVLEAIIYKIPPPFFRPYQPLKALVFSSLYDIHKGVIIYIRVFDGEVKKEDLYLYAAKISFSPLEAGVFTPKMEAREKLHTGEIGYIATGLKDLSLAKVGDTLMSASSITKPLAGFKEAKSMVFLCLYPVDNNEYPELRESLEKLHLSDSSFSFKPYSSVALGKGFICGFLGLLHAEVVKERLEREFDLAVIATTPTVEYLIELKSGKTLFVQSPDEFPKPEEIQVVKEPVMYVTIYVPSEYVGSVMQLCQDKRAEYVNLEYLGHQAKFSYLIPLAEMIVDFFDKLKSITSGYASLDYEFYQMKTTEAVKLDILLNQQKIDAFSQIIIKEKIEDKARVLVEKLKELIPRHQFQIPIQASIGGKIIARADVKSFRKDVTSKLYGGDRSRKDKLLEAQKKGKKKMREFGKVEVPSDVFIKLYKL